MAGPSHGMLLLGAPEEDDDKADAMSHDGHEESGLHTAVEAFAEALGIPAHKVDVEAACEAWHKMQEAKDAPAPEPEGEGEEEEPE